MTVCLSTNGPATYTTEAAPTKLLVATLDGVDILERPGPSGKWSVTDHVLNGKHVSALMIDPVKDQVFAGVHWGGLYRSKDDGATWDRCMEGITKEHVYSLAFVMGPEGPILYAGSEPVSLFRSTDLGDTWQELPAIGNVPGHEQWTFPPPPHVAHTKCLEFDPRDSTVIYAGIEQGALLKSTDGGVSWRELDGFYLPTDTWYKDIHRVVCRPSNPDELVMATGMGLYFSGDAGKTWEHLTSTDFKIGYPDQIILIPGDDNHMLVSGAGIDPTQWRKTSHAHGTVLRSRNGGRTWEDSSRGLPQQADANIEAMNATVYNGGMILFAGNTDGNVFASEDNGNSWERIATGLKPVSKGNHAKILHEEAPRV